MSSSTEIRTASRIIRGTEAQRVAPVVLGSALESCAPGEANAVDPRLRDRSMQEGYRAGYDEGYRVAYEEAHAAAATLIETAVATLSNAALQFNRRETSALEQAEVEVLDGILAIAEAVLQRELAVSTNPGEDALRRALAFVPDQGDLIVRMNPEDVATVEQTALFNTGRAFTMVGDASIERGDCIIDAGAARIDARIRSALDRVRETLQ